MLRRLRHAGIRGRTRPPHNLRPPAGQPLRLGASSTLTSQTLRTLGNRCRKAKGAPTPHTDTTPLRKRATSSTFPTWKAASCTQTRPSTSARASVFAARLSGVPGNPRLALRQRGLLLPCTKFLGLVAATCHGRYRSNAKQPPPQLWRETQSTGARDLAKRRQSAKGAVGQALRTPHRRTGGSRYPGALGGASPPQTLTPPPRANVAASCTFPTWKAASCTQTRPSTSARASVFAARSSCVTSDAHLIRQDREFRDSCKKKFLRFIAEMSHGPYRSTTRTSPKRGLRQPCRTNFDF